MYLAILQTLKNCKFIQFFYLNIGREENNLNMAISRTSCSDVWITLLTRNNVKKIHVFVQHSSGITVALKNKMRTKEII